MSIEVGLEYVGYLDPWTDEERLTDEEIVRCRDCKHFATNIHGSYCKKSISTTSDPNGYCAWGKRRSAR